MQLWTRAENYIGQDWTGFYPVASQTRDSGCVERANMEVILSALRAVEDPSGTGEEDGSASVQVAHDRHWLCGWVETVMVWEGDRRAVQKARELCERLESYAILSEERLAELEQEEAQSAWESAMMRDKVEWCREARVSIFAARRDSVPGDVVYVLAR